ncbi:Neural proliferation differentiation and control protein 1 [Chionoecetes opilio]|uniref:Neural proliferation differentiation and control protein 1 n=1 Tax=Chionoecetes opilio TaxID=41210 RepID=A0A8J4Y918_CHIOP|nr:Neural proliferation differentiation and control protein 1 [Chionoecetes opilio]
MHERISQGKHDDTQDGWVLTATSSRHQRASCTSLSACFLPSPDLPEACRQPWLNKSHSAARDAEYPAYGVTGPNKELSPSGDRKLAQSAHMYHYQHQKQQMIALEKSSGGERHGSTSDVDSEEEGEENEYTVYECPGLAPTGEMEVKNPLFHDDPTPATPSIRKEAEQDHDRHEEDKTSK